MHYNRLANLLAQQKQALGMTEAYIAARTGVSQPTVHRILSGKNKAAAWKDVIAIANVLGMAVTVTITPPADILDRRAQDAAAEIARAARATSQLEGQGLSDSAQQELSRETAAWLRASPKKLWWDE